MSLPETRPLVTAHLAHICHHHHQDVTLVTYSQTFCINIKQVTLLYLELDAFLEIDVISRIFLSNFDYQRV